MEYNETNYAGATLKKGDTIEFDYTGTYKQIDLPEGEYKFDCWGASGLTNGPNYPALLPGYGGFASGILELKEPLTLYLYIGGSGDPFNANKNYTTRTTRSGGATDIRLVQGVWYHPASLNSRIIVAGGGGAGLMDRGVYNGGDGGGLEGAPGQGSYGGSAGTQTGNKANDSGWMGYPGSLGSGGAGGDASYGGAGGYYGGGGSYWLSYHPMGSGGGSSFISGMEGCDAIDADGKHTGQPVHYSGLFFTETETQSGVRVGDGRIIITFGPDRTFSGNPSTENSIVLPRTIPLEMSWTKNNSGVM